MLGKDREDKSPCLADSGSRGSYYRMVQTGRLGNFPGKLARSALMRL